ncbi:hypothetical protein FQV27_00930 [Paracoccus aurantiacus]|uniref:Excalibur calcium-binding domain-containing protein n=1 Tax=Paracoccus aurantiacus TaxID=2599412 RepID=A0A5C6S7I4_9RHOB|nr:hypothetical protein [Paracoccus aurantiacus]TXB70471.1 hypothetical protein FQV27_00930 [Paracoccus aurantiacus]
MKKVVLGLACALGVSACADGTGQVLDPRYRFSGATPYDQYRAQRELALTGQGATPTTVPKKRPFAAPTPEQIASPTAWQRIEASRARAGQAAGARGAGGGYYDPATGRRVTASGNTRSAAVTAATPAVTTHAVPPATVTEAEADRLRRYAVTQNHPVGEIVYPRTRGTQTDAARACAQFPNAEAAQLMFLSSGGPQRDPLGMDPDGDGFVCEWDPTYYMAER